MFVDFWFWSFGEFSAGKILKIAVTVSKANQIT